MSIYKELGYDRDIDPIRGIRFSILSPDEIRNMSVAEITKTDTYVGTEPVMNGLFDSRMGQIDFNKICQTCEEKNIFCPGHFGHINLAKPVFYIQFFDVVKKILKCVCFRCSKILINTESDAIKAVLNKKLSRQKRWDLLYKQYCSKIKRCGHDTLDGCGAKQPDKIYKEPIVKVVMEWKDLSDETKKQVFNAEEIYRILARISDKDCEILGFSRKYNRPEWMVCTVLPVPPPSVRPSVRTDTGQRSEDDLTHKLCDIVKSNNALKMKIEKGASKEQIDIATQVLQYHVATFIDNNIPGINPAQQRTGRLLKSLTERLKSKDGRIRGNLMGKRVDFSARSVITPDPNISMDELGVPIKIAMNLTFPEVVNKYNIDKLTQLVINGPDVYPGAKFVRKGNWTKGLKNMPNREDIVLEFGDIVDRHMIDGDNVLFNRQPSLHKYSMLCHRVKVMPYNTFRLNVVVCNGYNADFDGDEMNLHLPQSITTSTELIELAAVPNQIISVRECKPIVGIVQDICLGVYRFTKSSVMVSEKQLFNLLSNNLKFVGDVPKPFFEEGDIKKWQGRQLMSMIIPNNINLKFPNNSYDETKDDKENYVIVENGVHIQGIMDKHTYQARSKGIIHSIFNDCSPQETRLFFDNTQRMICDWLVLSGFSVGISDLVVSTETNVGMRNVIHNMKIEIYDMIHKMHTNTFENTSISNNNVNFEFEVNKKLNDAREKAGKLGLSKINDMENRMINMVKSGSKGSKINVAQMIACLGQVNVDGKRIAYGFDDRTLPHYQKYDDGPESRGFVENSFITGLTPQEFFFHAMGGREGLIDTAVKSVVGSTPIIVIENGKPKRVLIGDWIDSHMDSEYGKDEKQVYPKDRNMEFLKFDHEVYIPTADNDGNTSWGLMTAVTRHDPSERLYEFTTEGGRTVVAAESKTMLIWNDEEKMFEPKHSKEVKEGDRCPVTAYLPDPPIIHEYFDMTEYFPKNQFIYGSEFYKAWKMMNEAMKKRKQIPRGWWEDNNNKTFTLPYTKKASLTRATSGRSDTDNIKEGCIYPYHASRDSCRIPDKFELTKENGIFIGLYLAEGCCRIKEGSVNIANNDKKVRDFVAQWFDKFGITHRETIKETEIKTTNGGVTKGTSSSIIGNSTLMVMFIDKFVGHGSENKYVPDIAFTAPKEFVAGLLNGYFSGDGSVFGGITSSSASSRLTEGISFLCSRFNIFGKISVTQLKKNNVGSKVILPANNISIRSLWANNFKKNIDLLIDKKDEKLKNLKTTTEHINFPHHKDIVQDRIVNIKVIEDHKEVKLYDVTVPSTLNFSIGNGLNCLDTSETGYIQRKLVKAMEDCKLNYDNTVRNASGSIIQFLYGEDGMDGTKIESQILSYIDSDYAKLKKEYHLTKEDELKHLLNDETIKEFYKTSSWEDIFDIHFKIVLSDREFVIKELFDSKRDNSIMYPISFIRIINSAKAIYNKYLDVLSDLNPMYVLTTLDKLSKELYINANNPGNKLLGILIRHFLSPKKILFNYQFTRTAFDYVVQQIRMKFYDAVANPSEMVGVIAAQSIGEPATQMCMKRNTNIHIMSDDNSFGGTIGEFIDNLLEKNKSDVIVNGKDSVVLDLKKDYKIIGVSNEEKTAWKRISQVSRHPANGGMVKVTTRSGKTTTATLTHSFLKRTEKGIDPTLGSDLKMGDRIPVAKYIPEVEDPFESFEINTYGDVKLDKDFGWLCGAYLADGYVYNNKISISKIIPEYYEKVMEIVSDKFKLQVTQRTRDYHSIAGSAKQYWGLDTIFNCPNLSKFFKDEFATGSGNKFIPSWVFGANKEFISGLIQGYFDGDGNVNGDAGKGMIRNGSISERLIDDMIVLLAYFGIFASKCLETSRDGAVIKPFYTIQISRKYASLFKEEIGFVVKSKAENLDKIIEYMNREEKSTSQEMIDKIPCLGEAIAYIGEKLQLPGQSRLYGRWKKKESIGRTTLINYIKIFEEANKKQLTDVADKISILKQAAYGDVVWDEIINLEYLDDPKEFVYDFTVPGNDSFMVDCGVLVHNTLNSVEWNTEMLFSINNKLEKTSIGKFIDEYIETTDNSNIENHDNDTKLAWIKNMNIKVLSSNTEGKITWEKVEAVTKHPPINKDGTNTLLKIKTRSGREVIATKAKSFLKRVNNEIIQVNGDSIKIGDHLPISKVMPISKDMIIDEIHITRPESILQASDENVDMVIDIYYKTDNVVFDSFESSQIFQQLLLRKNIIVQIITVENGYKLSEITEDIIPDIITEEHGTISIHRHKVKDYLSKSSNEEDKLVYQKILDENIMYDKIISIEDYTSEHPYVYDLTVENTRNFNIFNGLAMADTFHLSGVSSASKAVRGVPRIKELLSITANIKEPSMTIYISDKDNLNKDKARCKQIMYTIQTIYFNNIITTTKIFYEPDDFNSTIDDDKLFLESYKELVEMKLKDMPELSPWLLRMEFDKDKMLEYEVTMLDIYHSLQDFYDDSVHLMFSDDNSEKLVIRIKTKHTDNDEEKDMITDLKALEKNILDNLIIKGIRKVSKVVMSKKEHEKYNDETMLFDKFYEWTLDTSGTNLIDILAHKYVDKLRTISNDVNEIYSIFGIEAARQALYNEIWDVIRDADLYLNYRHLSLLVDTMTNKGYLLSIDRHGINRVDIGPLAKCSFEETNDMIIQAGIFSEIDKINGVSANIMLGQVAPCGCGDGDLIIDEQKLQDIYIAQEEEEEEEELDKEEVCNMENFEMDFTVPSKIQNISKKSTLKLNIK